MNDFYKNLMQFTERFGHMLSRLILTILYFLFVMPAGLVITLFGDPLKMRRPTASNWRKIEMDMSDKKRARSQL